jgi:hypothetical protein
MQNTIRIAPTPVPICSKDNYGKIALQVPFFVAGSASAVKDIHVTIHIKFVDKST